MVGAFWYSNLFVAGYEVVVLQFADSAVFYFDESLPSTNRQLYLLAPNKLVLCCCLFFTSLYRSVAQLRLDPHGPRGVVGVVVGFCCCCTCSAWHPAKRCYHIWVIAVLWKYETRIDIVLSNCI
jgi:hypothetical protein